MICASCGKPITGPYWHHARLDADVHGTEECLRNVKGEDVRMHTMMMMLPGEKP